MEALRQAQLGIGAAEREYRPGFDLTGRGYAATGEQKLLDIFNELTSDVDPSTVLSEPIGRQIGTKALGARENLFRTEGGEAIGTAFPGDAFQSIDDDIIDKIVGERTDKAQRGIARFGGRGNLSEAGARTASESILGEVPKATERLQEVGQGVLGGARRELGDIRGRAEAANVGFQLGDPLFDVAPFGQERTGLLESRAKTLPGDITTALGTEPLFNVPGALTTAGRSQGLVSGIPGTQRGAFLDAITKREQDAGDRTRRGLSTAGSGVF
jgi:hypothetical protein